MSFRTFIGSAAWILCGQYFIIEFFVASAWKVPVYSFRHNTISDLGATQCPYVFPGTGMVACSPLHFFMNACFVVNGVFIILGCFLLRQTFFDFISKSRLTKAGIGLLGTSALGLIGVGFFPENVHTTLHIFSATWFFSLANLGLVLLGIGIYKGRHKARRWLGIYTGLSGLTALIALVILGAGGAYILGTGFIERIVGDPLTIWLVVVGIYSINRFFMNAEL
jgi:hypothetical membrane protein